MTDEQPNGEDQQSNSQFGMDARRILGNAFGFVRGQEATQTFQALTFEECLDQQIQAIEGDAGTGRSNELDRIARYRDDLLGIIDQIKSLDPAYFDTKQATRDANTNK